jgi:hypothetical protein
MMHEGKRPGGLTALAVFNFIAAGIDLVGIVSLVLAVTFGAAIAESVERQAKERTEQQVEAGGNEEAELSQEDRQALAALRAFREFGGPGFAVYMGLLGACTCLLVAAGVGYLRQRRWGRLLGNIYAACSIATMAYGMWLTPAALGGGFRFAAFIGFVYPVLTLVVVNMVFREDLQH